MFDIAFTTDTAERQDLNVASWVGLRGRTTLGAYAEELLAPLGRWARADYERQWLEAGRRVLSPAARAGFFRAAFQFWWTMRREREVIYVQEEFLTPERLARVTDYGAAPYHVIEDRRTHTKDGARISEWRLCVADVHAFLERRASLSASGESVIETDGAILPAAAEAGSLEIRR